MNKFGSNTQPKKFGRGAVLQVDWLCLCDTVNRRYLVKCTACGMLKRHVTDLDAYADEWRERYAASVPFMIQRGGH